MKKILLFLVAFFPLLAGATTSNFQIDPSTSDLNTVEVNSINIEDGNEHEFYYFNSSHKVVYGLLIKPECRDNIYIFKVNRSDGTFDQLLAEMRAQPEVWQWYDCKLNKIDGYKNNPIIYPHDTIAWMKAACSADLKTTIESFPGFIKWVQ